MYLPVLLLIDFIYRFIHFVFDKFDVFFTLFYNIFDMNIFLMMKIVETGYKKKKRIII